MIKSQIKPRSAEFRANAERMQALVSDLREKVATVSRGGDQAARDKDVAQRKTQFEGALANMKKLAEAG